MAGSRDLGLLAASIGWALLVGVGGAFTSPAFGQERERGYERHDERGRHEFRGERRDERDRDRRWESRENGYRGYDYGYDVPSYGVPPPIVYSPPPPPPGINFLFSFR
jgi:hypothetical protein